MKTELRLKVWTLKLISQYGNNSTVLLFADPPYFTKGPMLYKFYFNTFDHKRLAAALQNSKSSAIITYDDHPEIRQLYAGSATARKLTGTYCCSNKIRPKASELLLGIANPKNVIRKAGSSKEGLQNFLNRYIPLTDQAKAGFMLLENQLKEMK